MLRYLFALALICGANVASAQIPDTVFLERLTWDEVRDLRAAGKTTIIIPTDHVHHDPRWWPDPESFDASRFLQDAKDRPRSAYLPFSGGRRICIGQSFALMEMVLVAAIMSQRFTFDLASGHPVEFEATLTVRPKYGVHLIARSRS